MTIATRTRRALLAFALGAIPAIAAQAAARAAPLALRIENISVADDERIHQPVLKIVIRPADHAALRAFSSSHIGARIAFRVDGETLFTTVIREPLLAGRFDISGIPLTQMRRALNLVSSGRATVELEPVKP